MKRERRRAPRFQFIAPAELVEETSGARVLSWVADLGLHGCSLSVRDAPRDGAVVRLKIGTTPRETFSAMAVVVHSEENRAGIAFDQVTAPSLEILSAWLAKAKFPTRGVGSPLERD
jgi:PilZ domain